ncbi:MAG: hypothetical protein GWN73_36705, partial [Actinobacteria bacterium]|nr:hypothetical protein [Actinomycetota bacterium]NIU70616.1 hypothetical protein [Actinomycetota bacterium]NIV55026.1 hypothetical protein [Actinomycetota bacterium]NIX49872.1 hypothetical protein [Actinomycetota bacterium]
GRLLLVPRIEGEYATVGTIADIQEVTQENGRAALISGVARATFGAASTRGDDVLWVDAERVYDEDLSNDRDVRRLAAEY